MTQVINKINITAEAVFEYEYCLGVPKRPCFDELLFTAEDDWAKLWEQAGECERPLRKMDKPLFKREVEDYIDLQNRSGRLLCTRYFRCLWFDEGMNKMLMLFFYRKERLGIMQHWDLAGIKFEDEWSEDDEWDGTIRHWLKAKLDDDYKGDWVIDQIERAKADEELGNLEPGANLENIPKEARNAIKYGGRDNAYSEELPVCETASEEWARWSKAKNAARIRRMFGGSVERGRL